MFFLRRLLAITQNVPVFFRTPNWHKSRIASFSRVFLTLAVSVFVHRTACVCLPHSPISNLSNCYDYKVTKQDMDSLHWIFITMLTHRVMIYHQPAHILDSVCIITIIYCVGRFLAMDRFFTQNTPKNTLIS